MSGEASAAAFALSLSFISSTFSGVAVLLFTRKAFFLSQELKARLNAINMLNAVFSVFVFIDFSLVVLPYNHFAT
ncbi:hypothetical protein AGMMS49593_03070 [Endomicrobiia bacterium]|nr:hypothetical protein AGMMS49593_03070 [Endomicrobiia bacterium]